MLTKNTSLLCICFEDYQNSLYQAAFERYVEPNRKVIAIRPLLENIRSPVLRRLYFSVSNTWVMKNTSLNIVATPGAWDDADGALSAFHAGRSELEKTVWVLQCESHAFYSMTAWLKVRLPLCNERNLLRFVRVEVYDRTIFEDGDPCL